MPDRKIRQAEASFRANKLALDLLDKHVNLAVASNAHYKNDAIYSGLLYLSLNNTYAETAMEDLRIKHHIDAPSGTEFLYRVKKLFGIQNNQMQLDYFERMHIQMEIWEKLTGVNDELVTIAVSSGLFKKPVICAIDYTKLPYYGSFNSNVVRGKHDKGTELFYEYAAISVVENGRRMCVYTIQITLLSEEKHEVLRRLITQALERGIKIKMLLVDRAFFTVDCINTLNEMGIKFIMPCVGNERVKAAIDTFGRTGKIAKFPIYNSERAEASFTMIIVRNDKGELIAFATNINGWSVKYFVRRIPKEYRKRWSIETTFRKMKEIVGMTTSTLPELRLVYFMLAMILYNVWQVVNYCFLCHLQASYDSKKEIFVTIRAMIRFFVNYLTQTQKQVAPLVYA
ncbi:MAG: transposase [Nitrososphaerota archaeon]|nr:transposase [Nitrososphaerota archaeon]